MQRFVYTPRVECFIKLKTGKIIDVSDEIISGSISLRLNAMSEAELTLQNKHGRFVRTGSSGSMISPMDQIVIKMSRVGQPENVFAGYVDDSPHYQLYSGPVTIRASCILKLLQHTYFDPGVMAMAGMFYKYGWYWDGTESLKNQNKKWDAIDSTGSVKDLIRGMLMDVAGWPADMIQIQNIPPKLITDLAKIIVTEDNQWNEDYDRVIKKLLKTFAIDSSANQTIDVGGQGPGGAAAPVSGNIDGTEIALMLMDAGATEDEAAKLLAIAMRESGLISDNINYNGGGDGSSEDGSYDFGLYQFNTVHAANATNGGKGLSGPGSGASLTELKQAVKQQPQWVQDFYDQMSDPRIASAKAVRFVHDGGYGAWGGEDSISSASIAQAQVNVAEAVKQRGNTGGATTTPVPGPDESDVQAGIGVTYILTHGTSNLDSRRGGSSGDVGAIDLSGSGGQAVYAPEDGTVGRSGSADPGGSLYFSGKSGQEYWLGHVTNQIAEGTPVKAGTQIAVLYDQGGNTHLHFAGFGWYAGTNVAGYTDSGGDHITVASAPIMGSGTPGGSPNVGGGKSGVAGAKAASSLSPGAVRDIAAQTFFSLSIGGFDQMASTMLRGERALSNDISLMEWLSNIITGAGRVFTSDAQGYFRAFYPDYFGIYGDEGGQTPTFFISEIEILDLTIQQNDTNLTTHVFGTGPITSWEAGGLNIFDRLLSTVASVEHPAFDWFLTIDEKANFNSTAFLKRYGARPYNHDMPYILKPELLWMGSWMKFLELWSMRFATSASFTFMPEIRPGWLLNIGNRVQMFVNSVTHSFNYTSGFTTNAELTSAATLTDDIDWLPRAGLSSVIDSMPDFADPPADAPEAVLPEDIPEGSPIHPR